MTNEDRIIDLFDKYHLGELNVTEKHEVEEMIAGDGNLKEVFDFRYSLISAVRQNKREELRQRFLDLEKEIETDNQEISEAEIRRIIPLQRWIWSAAAAVILLGLGAALYLNNMNDDSKLTRNPKDTLKNTLVDTMRIPEVQQEKNLATKDVPQNKKVLQGIVKLPYYETANGSLGFGKNDRPADRVITLFEKSAKSGYDYGDTLKIYLPQLPDAALYWKVVYDKATDIYILTNGTNHYELFRDRGWQPLKMDK